jgi:hypothetical protein
MEIINVVTVKNGVVIEVKSFGIPDIKSPQETVEKAEKYFEEKAREYGYDEDDYCSIDVLLEDGFFAGTDFSINILWSQI